MRKAIPAVLFLLFLAAVFLQIDLPAEGSLPQAFNGAIRVFVDREEVTFSVPPVFCNGRLLVPMRAFLEAMGAEIGWDGEAGTVFARRGDNVVVLKINEPYAVVNGEKIELDAPATIVQGSTMVPLRFLSTFLGMQVRWNEEERTAEVESGLFVPFKRFTVKDWEKLDPCIRDWVESSWDNLGIQARKKEGKLYILTTFGLKLSGGYDIEIRKIERVGGLDDCIKAVICFSEPLYEQYTIPVFSRPFDLVSVDLAQIEGCTYLLCFTRGLREGELPVRVEFDS